MKNKLIVLEGIDGVGKTTAARLLKKMLARHGIRAVSYEAYERKMEGFNKIKSFVRRKTSIDASLFFYLASAIYKSSKISEFLRDNWVICDRYIYSTLSYHKVRGARMSLVARVRTLPVRLPDFYFLLTVQEEVRMKRARMRKHRTPADSMSKEKGNMVDAMERELQKFGPFVIDNTKFDPGEMVRKMESFIFKDGR